MMEAFIQLEKENVNLCFLPSKAHQGLSGLYTRGSQPLRNTKKFNVPKAQANRKVLGHINQHMDSRKSASSKQVQARKRDNLVQQSEKYPEIETFLQYNPLDYERFHVPEEHKLSDCCLAGVPLFVSMDDVKTFDALTSPVLSPMENEVINYDYQTFAPLLEDIIIALPFMCDF
ncbi:securin-like [Mixophyes fleayi]|uniref:securin-like n=1 Tax=Mixophyes fleayi TaxID=3061075 RepID=UPI003F4D9DC5